MTAAASPPTGAERSLSRLNLVSGSIAYYRLRPRELLDRARSECERRRESAGNRPLDDHPLGTPTDAIHDVLGVAGPCAVCDGFDEVWDSIRSRFTQTNHHDSGLATVAGAWAATRHLSPTRVIETGVARGFTTAAILQGLARNGHGHLFSIDLPEINLLLRNEAAAAVDPALATRWTWLRGSSRRLLPKLLEQLGSIDVFIHDSLHTHRNMLFEMRSAWAALRPGGLLLVDDAGDNLAFEEFVASVEGISTIRRQGNRAGVFGVVRKP